MSIFSRTTIGGLLIGMTAAVCVPALPVSAASAPATAPTQQVQGVTYKVRRGDCMWLIAKRNHTTVARLVQLNKGRYPSLARNPRLIHVGWVLTVR